ncbi:hypothetical protein IEQ34_025483 [Dendrobium chrysotoxum]|uniref:Uncharacterized protein n=1 Tax=Dendrobium chrysotoxum TaxID=161865 RepID=A0AAV7FJ11_DENCH|nr:hypothetical protein IEQ34_025483 [Dendrobium chrysotoxum]
MGHVIPEPLRWLFFYSEVKLVEADISFPVQAQLIQDGICSAPLKASPSNSARPVLDRGLGSAPTRTTNSKACSSSHLTSKMTYSRVIAVTRTAVLIKEGSVFCIALKKKPISSHVGGKNHRDFRQTDKSLSKRAEQSQNGNSMDSPLKETDLSSPGSPISIDSGNDELQMLFHKSSLYLLRKVKEVFSDLLLLHGSLVLGGSRRNLCVFEEDAVAKLRGSR